MNDRREAKRKNWIKETQEGFGEGQKQYEKKMKGEILQGVGNVPERLIKGEGRKEREGKGERVVEGKGRESNVARRR